MNFSQENQTYRKIKILMKPQNYYENNQNDIINQPIIKILHNITNKTQNEKKINVYNENESKSKRLDNLFELCIKKSDEILERNKEKLQIYLKNKQKKSILIGENQNIIEQEKQEINELKENIKPIIVKQKEKEYKNESQIIENLINLEIDKEKEVKNDIPIENLKNNKIKEQEIQTEIEKEIKNDIKSIENLKNSDKFEKRLQLDTLFEKCTQKTKDCLESVEFSYDLKPQTKFYEDESIYKGILKNGLREGQGVLYSKNGTEIYNGEWKKDLKDGKGIINLQKMNNKIEGINENWVKYIGEFKEDKMEGNGIIMTKDDKKIIVNISNKEIFIINEEKETLNMINEEED